MSPSNIKNEKIIDTSKKAMNYLKKSIELNEESIKVGNLFCNTITELNELISDKYKLIESNENIAYPYELLVKFVGNELSQEELNEIQTFLCNTNVEVIDYEGFKTYNFSNEWMNKSEDMPNIVETYEENIRKIENGEKLKAKIDTYNTNY